MTLSPIPDSSIILQKSGSKTMSRLKSPEERKKEKKKTPKWQLREVRLTPGPPKFPLAPPQVGSQETQTHPGRPPLPQTRGGPCDFTLGGTFPLTQLCDPRSCRVSFCWRRGKGKRIVRPNPSLFGWACQRPAQLWNHAAVKRQFGPPPPLQFKIVSRLALRLHAGSLLSASPIPYQWSN